MHRALRHVLPLSLALAACRGSVGGENQIVCGPNGECPIEIALAPQAALKLARALTAIANQAVDLDHSNS